MLFLLSRQYFVYLHAGIYFPAEAEKEDRAPYKYMKPEDIEDFTEENKNEEIEQTNTDSQENGGQSDSTTHSEYKIPWKGEGRISYHLSGIKLRIGF